MDSRFITTVNENVSTLVTQKMIEKKVIWSFALITTGAFSRNFGKLFSELKLVCAEALENDL